MMKHIVFYSGGIGSWATAKRVVEKVGKENVILLFTDTLIEDNDLYRFIDESTIEMGCSFVRIADGRTPFDVYKDKRFLGNSRIAPCSHVLKQNVAKKWIEKNYSPDECVLYLGIDWTEEHRTHSPRRNWLPYRVEFPMCNEPYVSKDEMLLELEKLCIKIPFLYTLGFSHNNCGGFCCRAGQGHFIKVLDELPDRYEQFETMEKEMQMFLGKEVTMLSRVRKGVKQSLSLEQLREEWLSKRRCDIDLDDIGGCGCFVDDDKLEKEALRTERDERNERLTK